MQVIVERFVVAVTMQGPWAKFIAVVAITGRVLAIKLKSIKNFISSYL